MPFTLAHPAAAVPFTKYRLPLSALVVGSMAPDFPYFIYLSTSHQYGHTLLGIFLFCVPVGLVVLGLFHGFLKRPLLSLLPTIHQARLVSVAKAFGFWPARQLLLVVIALLLGASTHVAWDSFTHADGWSVQHIELLRWPLIQTSRGTLYVFKLLQHWSTLLGCALLAHWYRRWFKQAATQVSTQPVPSLSSLPGLVPENLKGRLLWFMVGVAAIFAGLYSYGATSSSDGASLLQLLLRNFVVMGVAAMGVELVIFSGLWHLKAHRDSKFADGELTGESVAKE